jgi:hypothetical protein
MSVKIERLLEKLAEHILFLTNVRSEAYNDRHGYPLSDAEKNIREPCDEDNDWLLSYTTAKGTCVAYIYASSALEALQKLDEVIKKCDSG